MKKFTRKAVAVLCCGAMAASLFTACGKKAETEESTIDTAIVVDMITAARGSIQLQGTYVGNVSAGESVNIIPMATATVQDVMVVVGSEVKEGQVLAQLDSKAADLSMAQAQAAYDSVLAQAQSALGGTWSTNMYQAERGIETLQDNIDTFNEQIDDANDKTNKAKSEMEAAESVMNQTKTRETAKAKTAATTAVTALLTAKQQITVNVTSENIDIAKTLEKLSVSSDMTSARIPVADGDMGSDVVIPLIDVTAGNSPLMGNINGLFSIVGLTNSGIADSSEQAAVKTAADAVNQANSAATTAITKAATDYQAKKATYDAVKAQVDPAVKQLETQRDSLITQKETTQGTLDITKNQTYNDTVNSLQKGLAQAQVGLDSASYQKSLYTIKAPISGIVESVGLVKDGFATSSAIAFTISNKDSMVVTFYVAEDVRDEFSLGQPVTVTRGGRTYTGAITEVGNAVDMQKGLFKVKATIYNAPDIATGVTASITTTCHSANNVLVIPCDAVYYDRGQAYVFVASNGVAVKTNVETGIYDDENIAIISGLIDGQQVITTWSPNLVDGASVIQPGEGGALAPKASQN